MVFLAVGFFTVYTRKKATRNKVLTWAAAAVFAVVVGTPYAAELLRPPAPAEPIVDDPDSRRLLVRFEGAT
jgi:hypothetical protein